MPSLDDLDFEESSEGLVAQVELHNLRIPVDLYISRHATLVQERQERTILSEFLAAWPNVEARLRKAVFAYYLATCETVEDCGTDVITEENVWSFAEVNAVQVPEILPVGRFVQLSGSCSWEEEHGLEICVRNGSDIIYVGPYSGKSHREPNTGKPWNHAPDA